MNGITLDILTVILLVLLAFTWGINAGKSMAKEEIRRNAKSFLKSFAELGEQKKSGKTVTMSPDNASTISMTSENSPNEIWKLFMDPNAKTNNGLWKVSIEPDDKAKKGENDQQ